jgi:ribulose-phosphate 3-epimerase
MAQIVPAILEDSYEKFLATYSQEVRLPGVERIHVDFGDGDFIPNALLPVSKIDALTPANHWEAHLMVREPSDFLDYKICGFGTIIIHFEAFSSQSGLERAIGLIREQGMEPAVCINPETPVAVLSPLQDLVKHFQIMGVHPGAQGHEFLSETLERIQELRQTIPNAIIHMDGGANADNVRLISESGADFIVAGSSLTKSPSMAEAYEKMTAVLNKPAV